MPGQLRSPAVRRIRLHSRLVVVASQPARAAEVRSWRLHQHTGYTIGELARWINPIVRGWMQYYEAFFWSALKRGVLASLAVASFDHLVQVIRHGLKRSSTSPASSRAASPEPG